MKYLAYISWLISWFFIHSFFFIPIIYGGHGGVVSGFAAAVNVGIAILGFTLISRKFKNSAILSPSTNHPQNPDATSLTPTSSNLAAIESCAIAINEDHIYTVIAQELESGLTDKGLWTRLFSESGGDENKTKALYIRQRADRLVSTERLRQEQVAKEQAARAEILSQIRYDNSFPADPRLVAAVWNGDWNIANKLLREGVSPTGSDENGNSLVEVARKQGDEMMSQLLETYLAE